MFCCGLSLATASVGTTPKCCFKCFLKLFSCCRGRIGDDGQDGHDNGHDIHLKCVLACCTGTVADNDIADRPTERSAVQSRKKRKHEKRKQETNERKLFEKKKKN